jgi:predicted acetyltransferase
VSLVVRPHKVNTHEGVSFQVSDQGIGMTEIQVNNIFREFTQADSSTTREYGGTGLGLAISKHFCEMMGGYIRVTSVKDEGSVFTVFLPRVANNASASEEDEQESDDNKPDSDESDSNESDSNEPNSDESENKAIAPNAADETDHAEKK